jgi:glycosyltransferase involved in cell wall biosynthesis
LVEGRDLLYVPPGDIEAAAAAVRRLVNDHELLAQLRHNARMASAVFSWDGIAEAHEREYLAAQRTPP